MKLAALFVLLLLLPFSGPILGQENIASPNEESRNSFSVIALNPSDHPRPDEIMEIDLSKIKSRYPSFNENAFVVRCEGKEIMSELYASPEGFANERVETRSEIIFVSSFAPREKKSFEVVWKLDTVEVHNYPRMTQAALGMKVDYKKVDGYYTGGRFVDVDSTTVPSGHFAHDALYRIEGPGWESDKIVYRFYLDSRNRNDIFGKKTHDLVLQKIGENDLVSDSRESYTNMLDWGMDVFKVGESLGIGSIAMWHDSKVVTVSDVGKVECGIFNGPIRSGVMTKYFGWKVGREKYDLLSELSIAAGSRLTKVGVFVNNDSVELCTGLAKHDSCDLIKSSPTSKEKWAYLALYGKQSLSGDNLGIAVFYRKQDQVKLTEDSTSEIVVLRPISGRVSYYFGAAWEQEPGGIKNEEEFKKYLDETIVNLGNPIQTSF
jgi:hypothetical protein